MSKRSTPEWIGRSPDAKIPARVRLRVFDRFDGVCQITSRKIQAGEDWECDHEIALANGGEHREGNLRPVLATAHRAKTADDVRVKAKCDRVRKKHLGIHKSSSPLPGGRHDKFKRKIGGGVVLRGDD